MSKQPMTARVNIIRPVKLPNPEPHVIKYDDTKAEMLLHGLTPELHKGRAVIVTLDIKDFVGRMPADVAIQFYKQLLAMKVDRMAAAVEPKKEPPVIEVDRPDVVIPAASTREKLQDELREIEGSMDERTPVQAIRHRDICRILAEAKCRHCGVIYDGYKSRADLQGFCSAKCQHERAKHHGYRRGGNRSEYQVLKDADDIGSVWVCK